MGSPKLNCLQLTRRKVYALITLCLLGLIFIAYACVADAEPAIVIVGDSGTFERGSLPRDYRWQGLFCNHFGCKIRPVEARITSSERGNVLDELEETDELNVSNEPLAVFHDVALANGVVTTWYKQGEPEYAASQSSQLGELGHWEMPWGADPLSIWRVSLPKDGGFDYRVGDGTRSQSLLRTEAEDLYGGDTAPVIHWVGDLDGDGKIDMLVSLPNERCGYDYRLYLSSLANEGEWVGQSAHFAGSEPACGC